MMIHRTLGRCHTRGLGEAMATARRSARGLTSLFPTPLRARPSATILRGSAPVVLSRSTTRTATTITQSCAAQQGCWPRGGIEAIPPVAGSSCCRSYYSHSVYTKSGRERDVAAGIYDKGAPDPPPSTWLLRRLPDRRRQLFPRQQQQRWSSSTATETTNEILKDYDLNDPDCNVSPGIASKLGTHLHRQRNHPLQIITAKIHAYFQEGCGGNDSDRDSEAAFPLLDDLSPVVTTEAAFDSLLIPVDHPSRSKTDTYYVNRNLVLRPHTSAHQVDLLRNGYGNTSATSSSSSAGLDQFLVAGDVYRRDEIDKSHYPVFHQMEGVKLFHNAQSDVVQRHLQQTLEGLARHLFGDDVPMRWVDAYFPFTQPSYELEIYYDNEWMEVLGCGVIHPQVLLNAGRIDSINDTKTSGWAFGLGLERLAMVLFNIPDIRLFWSTDRRFLSQFESGRIVQFQAYSKYPPVYKDVSFWLPESSSNGAATTPAFHSNDVYELIRNVGGDWIEQVSLLDEFVHPTSGRVSHCYRVTWRSMDRNLTNEEIDDLQSLVRKQVSEQLGAELR